MHRLALPLFLAIAALPWPTRGRRRRTPALSADDIAWRQRSRFNPQVHGAVAKSADADVFARAPYAYYPYANELEVAFELSAAVKLLPAGTPPPAGDLKVLRVSLFSAIIRPELLEEGMPSIRRRRTRAGRSADRRRQRRHCPGRQGPRLRRDQIAGFPGGQLSRGIRVWRLAADGGEDPAADPLRMGALPLRHGARCLSAFQAGGGERRQGIRRRPHLRDQPHGVVRQRDHQGPRNASAPMTLVAETRTGGASPGNRSSWKAGRRTPTKRCSPAAPSRNWGFSNRRSLWRRTLPRCSGRWSPAPLRPGSDECGWRWP